MDLDADLDVDMRLGMDTNGEWTCKHIHHLRALCWCTLRVMNAEECGVYLQIILTLKATYMLWSGTAIKAIKKYSQA